MLSLQGLRCEPKGIPANRGKLLLLQPAKIHQFNDRSTRILGVTCIEILLHKVEMHECITIDLGVLNPGNVGNQYGIQHKMVIK